MTMRWYVVHAYSGFEKSVQKTLLDRISRAGMQEKFGKILVPTEEVVEMKGGQKNISERKFFPGYVLVEMDMTDDAWHLVKNTPKVTGFVGGAHGRKPPPISDKEVKNILQQMQEGVEKPKPKVLFEIGEAVRVREGPFTDFHGTVEAQAAARMRLSDPGAPARHGHRARHALARVSDAARRQLRARRIQTGPAGLRHRRAAPGKKALPEMTATGAPVLPLPLPIP